MEITKNHHESGVGIYGISKPVSSRDDWKEATKVAKEMCEWLDKENGQFKGEFSRAFAIAHAQVCSLPEPWQLFVVDKEMVLPEKPEQGRTIKNAYFEAQAIFNCQILEAPDKIIEKVPQRKITKGKDGKMEVGIEKIDKEVSNKFTVKEGCMSFGHRKEKNVERKFRIKVRYQYHKKGLLGEKVETFEGEVTGLKAHIIQHECDHFAGKNIYFNETI